MGIVTKTIKECTCDVCKSPCGENDGNIAIRVNNGDRDVGPAYIYAHMRFDQPYGCQVGIVCFECKKKYLKQYLQEIGGM